MRNALNHDCPVCCAPATALCMDMRQGDGCEVQMNRVHSPRSALAGIPSRGGRSTNVAQAR